MEVFSAFVLPVFLSKGRHLPGTLATESQEKIQQTVNKPTSSLQQQNGSLLKIVNMDMFISCRIEKFSVQLKIDPNKKRGSKEGKEHYPLRISTPDADTAASSRTHQAVDANP